MGLVAPWHKESSKIRDQTHISCIDMKILIHWITREDPSKKFTTLVRIVKTLRNLMIKAFVSFCLTQHFINVFPFGSPLFIKCLSTFLLFNGRLLRERLIFLTITIIQVAVLDSKSLSDRIQYCSWTFSKIKIIALWQRYNQIGDGFCPKKLLKY